MKGQFERIVERFEEYQSRGISSLIAYQAHPLDRLVIDKLKVNGFTIKPYASKHGLFLEISK